MPKTWKDTKREYLLMLIKEGGLSNSQLDDIIREARRMTSDRAHISKVGSIEDMRRIVETCQDKGVEKYCPTCRYDCEQGNDHLKWGEQWVHDKIRKYVNCPVWEEHNANPNYALIPDGMEHEQAVRHLEYGPDMLALLRRWYGVSHGGLGCTHLSASQVKKIIQGTEGK